MENKALDIELAKIRANNPVSDKQIKQRDMLDRYRDAADRGNIDEMSVIFLGEYPIFR